MASLNTPICFNSTANSGTSSCAFMRSPVTYVVAVPSTYTITQSNFGTLKTALQTAAVNNSRASRIFFLGRFTNSEMQVTEPVYETTGDGSKILVKNEVVNFRLEMKGATVCDQKSLASFRQTQKNYKFLFYSSTGILHGQKVVNSTDPNLEEMGGFKAQLVEIPIQAGASYEASPVSYFEMNFPDYRTLQDNEIFFDASSLNLEDTFDVYRVTTVNLKKSATVTTAGVFKLKAASSCGANLGIDYKSAIAAGAFVATNGNTGGNLTITSAAANAATGEITVQLTTPPGVGVPVRITLASVSALTALGISYFEALNEDGTNYVEFIDVA